MIIRIAVADDAAALTALYRELVSDSAIRVSPAHLTQLATNPAQALLVAEQDDQIVGTAHLQFCLDAMYAQQPYALVENVVVSPSARGTGVGRALMAEIERRCKVKDCSKIMLLSSASRHDAHRFFTREGFSGERKRGFVKYRREFS